jgi:hypothetical protein
LLTVWTSYPTDVDIQYGAERDHFLKHYWRADVDGMEKEGKIYTLLESKGVPNIVPFEKGNDVRDHMSLTHTFRDEAPRAAVLKGPIDQVDGVFRLDVTHQKDKI